MIDYIKGKLVASTPANAVLERGGIGYFIHISLFTYSNLPATEEIQLFIHEIIREDLYDIYGFSTQEERMIFRHLISVSGIGPNTARMMLSSLTPEEVKLAILENNVNTIKSVKGIGIKTAQRAILDLKDKLGSISGADTTGILADNAANKEEAMSAMITLGFPKNTVEKTINTILKKEKNLTVEEIVKRALKQL